MAPRYLAFGLVTLCVWIVFGPEFGRSVVMGQHKDELVGAYERAGLNVRDCRSHSRSLVDPGGGMPDCLESTFRDAAGKINGGRAADEAQEAPVGEPDLQ